MTLASYALSALSIVVFLYYGLTCLFAGGMAEDFDRFRLAHLRTLTGTLEVLGALGLILGLFLPALVLPSAAGLALLMLMGMLTRLRHRDSFLQTLPAAVLLAVNVAIVVLAISDPRPPIGNALRETREPVPAVRAMTNLVDSLERAGFSGSVLVADQRDVLLFRTMGLADASTGRAIAENDRWRWASVSKQVTAAFVLREVDAGRIGLDEPVSTYLPGFSDSARSAITVRHLLQHSSGLPSEDRGPRDADGVPQATISCWAPSCARAPDSRQRAC